MGKLLTSLETGIDEKSREELYYRIGCHFFENGNYRESVKYLRHSNTQKSHLLLSQIHFIARDAFPDGKYYVINGMLSGDAMGEFIFAMEILTGSLKCKYKIDPIKILKRSALKGSDLAMHQLGDAYRYGIHGLKLNSQKAMTYYIAASKIGNPLSSLELSKMYMERVRYDIIQACKYMMLAKKRLDIIRDLGHLNEFYAQEKRVLFYAADTHIEKARNELKYIDF